MYYMFKCLILLWFLIHNKADDDVCPNKCECKRSTQRNGADFMKIKCGDSEKIRSLDEIDLLNIASEIIQLNLSDNALTSFYPKVQLIALQKLDLSRNRIEILENNQFVEVPKLRRLDISQNIIKSIEPLAFANLDDLERLKLSQNHITSIPTEIFSSLINMKQFDISNNPLSCDCNLLVFLERIHKSSIKLTSNPKCGSPANFEGFPLRKLKLGTDIDCRTIGNSGIPLIEITPNYNQIVFEGDAFAIECRAPALADTAHIEWTWTDINPVVHFADVKIEHNDEALPKGIVDSTLIIPQLKRNHSGIWKCTLNSKHLRNVTLIVISEETKYCPISITTNNKGTYVWPETVINNTVALTCESINLNRPIEEQKIFRLCSSKGEWIESNSTLCAYVSETTKILEQFARVDAGLVETIMHFKNYTSNLKIFKDQMDIVFAIDTIMNHLKYAVVEQIGGVLIDVINNLLNLPKNYMWEADYSYGSCRKLVNATETLAAITPSPSLHKSNLAMELFPLKRNGFTGLKCTWYSDVMNKSDRLFYCSTNSQVFTTELKEKIVEASVVIPETLFHQLEDQHYELKNKVYELLVLMHADGKLFPVDQKFKDRMDVVSAVIGIKLVGMPVNNLTDPIVVTLRTPPDYEENPFIPVWWNPQSKNRTGNWSFEGCHIHRELPEYITFICYHMGYYTLLRHIEFPSNLIVTNTRFKLSHPTIYIGSFILFTTLLVAICSYLYYWPLIQMPKKTKHALINIWIAIELLCFIYVFGIYQTEDTRLCQIVGIILHYFTLSTLLWMCVAVDCMYKRLSKNDDILDIQDDELPADQPIKKPIIGLYFVGWGVAMIVCGISAAINVREYATPVYCFLRGGPPFAALYIPACILLLFLAIYLLLIRCTIRGIDPNGHLSEGTQATENVDLDLLEPQFGATRADGSASSSAADSRSSDGDDQERSPTAQLKAHAILAVLYALAWICGAVATAEPFTGGGHEAQVFGVIYAVCASTLGAFTLFFYCVARNDVRGRWMAAGRRWRYGRAWFRRRIISDTNIVRGSVLGQITTNDLQPQVVSRSSSRTSSHTKTNSATSNNAYKPTHNDGTGSTTPSTTKVNNVNLLVLHRQQYRHPNLVPNIIENPTDVAEAFYNPHQSTVARRFFRRQKRHQAMMLMKRNNLEQDTDHRPTSASSIDGRRQPKRNASVDLFGTKAKVNNTNIHVDVPPPERNLRHRRNNPNLFSDSGDGSPGDDVPPPLLVERLVGDVDRLRRQDIGIRKRHTDGMRSVSQQCTLEYSSENVSDSILDTAEEDGVMKIVQPLPPPTVARTSSVSVSDLDELYQQIRRQPIPRPRSSPYLSDSEVNSFGGEFRYGRRTIIGRGRSNENVETTV